MVEIGLLEIGIGIGGFVIGFLVGKMNSGASYGDIVKGGKAGGDIIRGDKTGGDKIEGDNTEVGGNLAKDRAKQNN